MVSRIEVETFGSIPYQHFGKQLTASRIRKEFTLCIYFLLNTYAAIHGITFLTNTKNKLFLKLSIGLTYICPIFPFYTPWKYQKTKDFPVLSGAIKWQHWSEIGQIRSCILKSQNHLQNENKIVICEAYDAK